MRKIIKRMALAIVVCFFFSGFIGCDNESTAVSTAVENTNSAINEMEKNDVGSVRLYLTDFPIGDKEVKSVLIKITSIDINSQAAGWTRVIDYGDKGRVFDLLLLQNGSTAELGFFDLEPGTYDGIRLNISTENYILIEKDGVYSLKPLTVPAGTETGIQILGPFDVLNSGITHIVVDFDAQNSIEYVTTTTSGDCCKCRHGKGHRYAWGHHHGHDCDVKHGKGHDKHGKKEKKHECVCDKDKHGKGHGYKHDCKGKGHKKGHHCGCDGGGTSTTGEYVLKPVITIKQIESFDSITKNILADADGNINLLGEISVTIPAGSLPLDSDVTLKPMGEPIVLPFSSTSIIGKTYAIGPKDTILSKDMLLSMNYIDFEITDKRLNESALSMFYFDRSLNDWMKISSTVDIATNTVNSQLNTFAQFAIGAPPLTAPVIDPISIDIARDASGNGQVPAGVRAKIADSDGIASATLFYRELGDIAYYSVEMILGADGWYTAEIPLANFIRNSLTRGGIEVYIEAADGMGEISFAPVAGSLRPHSYEYNPDIDADGMNDRWEIVNGLDVTVDDSALDPDNDTFTNIAEFQGITNPHVSDRIPDPQDIISTSTLVATSFMWYGDSWEFKSVDADITVLPDRSAQKVSAEYTISFTRFYVVRTHYVMFRYITDTVTGTTGPIDYTGAPTTVTLYDDYEHIDEFFINTPAETWTPIPDYSDFNISYIARGWNSYGGDYSEAFNFLFAE